MLKMRSWKCIISHKIYKATEIPVQYYTTVSYKQNRNSICISMCSMMVPHPFDILLLQLGCTCGYIALDIYSDWCWQQDKLFFEFESLFVQLSINIEPFRLMASVSCKFIEHQTASYFLHCTYEYKCVVLKYAAVMAHDGCSYSSSF